MFCIQVQHRGRQRTARILSSSTFLMGVPDIGRTTLISALYAKQLNPQIISSEDGNCNVCRNVWQPSFLYAAKFRNPVNSKVKTCVSAWIYHRPTFVSFAMCCAMYQSRLIGSYLEMLSYFV